MIVILGMVVLIYIAGAYTIILTTNVAGCDSVHTLNLTIDNTVVNRDTVTSCYDYLWIPSVISR